MAPGLPQRFVILCRPRTGSYLTVELLNKFPSIRCHGELFKPARIELDKELKPLVGYKVALRDRKPLMFLNKVCSLSPNKITGFKLFESHPVKVREALLAHPGIKKVILHRNPIDIYLSLLRANATKQWTNRGDKEYVAPSALHFNSRVFSRLAGHHEKFYRGLDDVAALAPDLFFRIDYTDLRNDERIRQLAAFLGETKLSVPLEGQMQKQFVERYDAVVENYAQMYEFLERDCPELLAQSDVARQRQDAAESASAPATPPLAANGHA